MKRMYQIDSSGWTSHPEPKRKTDQYPGGNLPAKHEFFRLIEGENYSEQPVHSDGMNALKKSFFAALEGIQYTNEISCLRGKLRKAMIKLAEDRHKADNITIEPAKRKKMRAAAGAEFLSQIVGHQIVSEVKNGQTIWRLKPQ